ncbi:CHAT domain-containing protein [Sorangium sp. KYC3313]|uniref:CHAT domain-containing protein n=1 Tax=Sorangium sp. KYC3313 TaxID=3449740 RepID=UPI003F896E98
MFLIVPTRGSHLLELRWKQPLREDEVHALAENVLDEYPTVAKQSLRALVRLALTPQAWSRAASKARALLPKAANYDDGTYADILAASCRIPDGSLKDTLIDLLDGPLDGRPRRALLAALAREREPRILRHLFHELEHELATRRMAAARDLSAFPNVDSSILLKHLARENDATARFWIALALAVGGNAAPLLMFFQESRPERWYVWGDVIADDDTERFILHERKQLLTEEVRRALGSVKLQRSDPAESLLRELRLPAMTAGTEIKAKLADDVPHTASDGIARYAEAEEAERVVSRWILSMPDWEHDPQLLHERNLNFSQVDPRLRGRAVSGLFAHQFAYLRSKPSREPFAYGNEIDGFVADGGQTMFILVGRIIDHAVGIDVELLFRLYCEEVQKHVYTEAQLPAAAAYTSPREVLVATREALVSTDPELRRLAAEFIELARRNVGLGIPTWGGGGPPPDIPSTTNATEESGTDVLLYQAKLLVPAVVTRNERIRITIDLKRLADENADIRLNSVSPGWDTLTVDVSIVSTGITFASKDDEGTIALHCDGSSTPFEVEGLIDPGDDEKLLTIVALFSFRGRNCGWARAKVPIVGADLQPDETQHAGHVAIALEAKVPPLTLRLVRGDVEHMYGFNISVPEELRHILGMPDCLHGHCRLPQGELDHILEVLDHIAHVPNPDQARATLHGLGDLIYDLLPPAFHQAYCAIRRRSNDMFAIQFVSDDPGFPWELARPRFDGRRTNIICETHPVARWHAYRDDLVHKRLAKNGAILTVAPSYLGKRALPRAQEESAWLVETLGAQRLAPVSREAFLASLGPTADALSVLHVAAHGHFDRGRPLLSKLDFGDEYVNTAEIRGEHKEALRTAIVILNVCDAGASSQNLGGAVVSFLDAFIEQGAAAVIGPLWSVDDGSAMRLLKSCLPRILRGTSVAEALRDARYADDGSIDPLAFVLCGDVTGAFE